MHNKKYIDSYNICNKNLYEKCKNYYYHVIRPSKHIELEEDISINKNKLLKTKKFY